MTDLKRFIKRKVLNSWAYRLAWLEGNDWLRTRLVEKWVIDYYAQGG